MAVNVPFTANAQPTPACHEESLQDIERRPQPAPLTSPYSQPDSRASRIASTRLRALSFATTVVR